MYVSIYLSVYLSVCLKGRNSARLPPKVAGDRCKTRLFCEMFSIFELDSVTIDAILRDFKFWTWQHQKGSSSAKLPQFLNLTRTMQLCRAFLKKWNGACVQSWRPRPNTLWIGQMLSRIGQNAVLPRSPNMSAGDVSRTLPATWHACLQNHEFWNCYKTCTFGSLLTRCRSRCTSHGKPHPDLNKCSKTVSSSHFRPPNVLLARTAFIFPTNQVSLAFWLGNVLLASSRHDTTMACTLSTAHLPKVLRTCNAFCFLTCKSAPHHTCMQLFISHPARWLCTRRFSGPSGAAKHWKNTSSRTLLFFLLTPSLLTLSLSLCLSLLWLLSPLVLQLSISRKFDF